MERREYDRIPTGAEVIFTLERTNLLMREFTGIIEDISEGGFKIVLDNGSNEDILEQITEGEEIHFSIYDEYSVFGRETSALISGKAVILRPEKNNGIASIGCKFKRLSNEIEQYVLERKTSLYINTMKRETNRMMEM